MWRIILNYILMFLYLGLNLLYRTLRQLYWRFNGTHDTLQASTDPNNYKRSAHVKRVIYRHRIDDFINADESDFVTIHERFVDPEELLGEDYTLYTITRSEAVFVGAKPGFQKDVRRLYESDFYLIDQFISADKVITLPLNQFHKLAEDMKDDGAKLVFLQNQCRSGGTLLNSIFKHSKRCIAISEPHPYNVVIKQIFDDRLYHGEAAKRLFKNMVRILAKPDKSMGQAPLAYVIKPTTLNVAAATMARDVFPESYHFFMYRDPRNVSISLRRIARLVDTIETFYQLCRFPFSWVQAAFIAYIGYPYGNFQNWIPQNRHAESMEFGWRITCFTMFHYQEALRNGVNIHGIRYCDLCTHQKKFIRDMFTICDFPLELCEKAEVAISRDSHGTNSPVSTAKLQKHVPILSEMTSEFLDAARAMAEEYGVPQPEEWDDKNFRLPNSLTP